MFHYETFITVHIETAVIYSFLHAYLSPRGRISKKRNTINGCKRLDDDLTSMTSRLTQSRNRAWLTTQLDTSLNDLKLDLRLILNDLRLELNDLRLDFDLTLSDLVTALTKISINGIKHQSLNRKSRLRWFYIFAIKFSSENQGNISVSLDSYKSNGNSAHNYYQH